MAAGFDPTQFWDLTPRELTRYFAGAGERQRRAHDELAWLAWHVAALPKLKRFPALRELMTPAPRRARRQSREELVAVIKATFGALAARAERRNVKRRTRG